MNGEAVTYVVNRNINYTNICYYKCGFCAFSKGTGKEDLRGKPYDLSVDSVVEMAREARIPTYAPATINTDDWRGRIRELEPDALFSFNYRDILGPKILEIPRFGGVNVHGALLPTYRGRCPINWQLVPSVSGEFGSPASTHGLSSA